MDTRLTRSPLRLALALLGALALAACWMPRDMRGTTDEVTGGVLKIGLLAEQMPPEDAAAIERIAARLHAEPQVMRGPADLLLARLEDGQLHLLAGDIPANTPLLAKASPTNPVGHVMLVTKREKRVLLIRKGENRFLMHINEAVQPLTQETQE